MPAALPPTSMRCICTAGAAARIAQKSRALGSDASSLASKFVAVFVDVMSTTGDAPLTVTLSASAATFTSMFTVAVNPETDVRMPPRGPRSKARKARS